jgi:cell division protease FtsH
VATGPRETAPSTHRAHDTFLDAYAWCVVQRAFRHFAKRDAAFTGILVVPYEAISGHVERAASTIFGRGSTRYCSDAKDAASFLLSRPGARQSVAIFNDVDDVPQDLNATVDVLAVVGKPDAGSITAAVHAFFGVRISNDDATFLTYFTFPTLGFAFRHGDLFSHGLAALRRSADPKPLMRTPAAQKLAASRLAHKPTAPVKEREKRRSSTAQMLGLRGYGDAVSWGLQLCRDFDDYRDGKTNWDAVERGILLYGPPGTGKSKFARVLADACNVPLFSGSYAEWQQEGHQGDMLKAMKKAFERAIKSAPSILLIDEVDAFHVRAGLGDHATYNRGVTNGFLECLDGAKSREGVIVVATTNDIQIVDPAILRAGRIDTHVEITLPDSEARCAIAERYLDASIPAVDRPDVILRTNGFSGADIEVQVRRARRFARTRGEEFAFSHLLETLPPAIQVPDDLLLSWAVHESGHAVVGLAVGRLLETIHVERHFVEGSPSAGGAVRFVKSPRCRRTRDVILDDLMILLAGMAAETLLLGSYDVGGSMTEQSDLSRATRLTTRMEIVHGMGDGLISEAVQSDAFLDQIRQGNPLIARRVEAILQSVMEQATAVLIWNRASLELVAKHLLERQALTGHEVQEYLSMCNVTITRGPPANDGGHDEVPA